MIFEVHLNHEGCNENEVKDLGSSHDWQVSGDNDDIIQAMYPEEVKEHNKKWLKWGSVTGVLVSLGKSFQKIFLCKLCHNLQEKKIDWDLFSIPHFHLNESNWLRDEGCVLWSRVMKSFQHIYASVRYARSWKCYGLLQYIERHVTSSGAQRNSKKSSLQVIEKPWWSRSTTWRLACSPGSTEMPKTNRNNNDLRGCWLLRL